MSEWRTFETAQLINSGILAIGDDYRAKNSELSAEGLPFARAGNIDNGFHFEGADCFPMANFSKVGEKVSHTGDVVFTSKGTVGRFAFVNNDVPRFVYSPQLCYWRSLNVDVLDPRFLFYWMQGREFWEQACSVKGKTDMADYVSLSDQRRMSITLPPINDQRAIARILGDLDDKIELNRQINHTLEQIARAIFKSWFMDFELVRIRRGESCIRPQQSGDHKDRPYLTPEILALFPDELVDSELGEIPKGWEVRKVETILSRLLSKTRYTKNQVKLVGSVPVFEQGAGILLGYHDGPALFQATPEEPVFIFGDHTCVTHLACEPFDISQNVIPLKGKDRPTAWVYYAVKDKQIFQEYRRHWMELVSKNVVVPPVPICKEFAKTISSFLLSMEANVRESRTLATLRDTLLPKLLSGELAANSIKKRRGNSLCLVSFL